MNNLRTNLIPCPYTIGSTFQIRVTPPAGSPFETQITVVETYTPFTISPVMRVSLDSAISERNYMSHPLPSELVLKVYDRRFADDLREYYHLQPLTYETEALYHQYITSGRAPEGPDIIGNEIDAFGGFKTSPPELLEHFIATEISPYFDSECATYQRLNSLQGHIIPTFYGTTEFLEGPSVPGLSLSVRGVLLEVIEGISLEHMDTAVINVDTVLKSAMRIVDNYGDLGVLNHDVRLGNFLLRSDDSVAMIDFAQSRLRREDEDELEWRRAKWREDEEGCIGCEGMKRFGWPYVRSLKYLPPPEDEYI